MTWLEGSPQTFTPLGGRPGAEGLSGRLVEVASRQGRIVLALATQEAADVTTMLAHQRRSFVFWMSLQEYEQASKILDEHVGTNVRAARQHSVAQAASAFSGRSFHREWGICRSVASVAINGWSEICST